MANLENFNFNKLSPFKWFVLNNFPFLDADFDAMTEWQLFQKIGEWINKIIDSQNTVGSEMEKVVTAYNELYNYVDNFFKNLDVQDEINNKLNDMASDGTLETIVSDYLNPYIEEQNTKIENINNKVNSISSGVPIPVDNISKMIDTTKAYLLVTDGNWYYYNGSKWVAGGVYQSTSINNNSVYVNKLEESLQNCFKGQFTKVTPDWLIGYYNNKGNIESSQNYLHTEKIPVLPNEVYIFPQSFNTSPIVFFDEESNFVEYLSTNKQFVIPENVRFMGLTTTANNNPSSIKSYYKLNNYILNGQSQLNFGDMDDAFRNSFLCNYDEIDNIEWMDGYLSKVPNYINESQDFKYTQLLVTPGETYKISGTLIGSVKLVQLIGGDTIINYPEKFQNNSITINDYIITIPKNYNILNVSGYKSKELKIEKISSYSFIGTDNSKDYEYEIKQLQEFNINNQLSNDFKWNSDIENEKLAVFTFDDTLSDISTILNLFKSKNVPVCFATIPTRLNIICDDNRTAKDVLDDCISNGGEILSHWSKPLTNSSSDDDYNTVYIKSKQMLENAGYKVNGIITTGGTNYDTQDFVKDTKIARNNYFYGDLTSTGIIPVIEQYFNQRNFLDEGVEYAKQLIDNYINKTNTQPHSKWLNFASHGTKDTPINEIEEIVDYCIEKGIKIVTWNYIYNNYRSTILEEKIKSL